MLASWNLAAEPSCNDQEPAELIEQASTIFAGRLVKEELISQQEIQSTFEVKRVFKGNPQALHTIVSPVASKTCNVSYGHEGIDLVMVDDRNRLSSCCSYDVYYPIEQSLRADVIYRGITKALKSSTNCMGHIFLYRNDYESDAEVLLALDRNRYQLEAAGIGSSYLKHHDASITCFSKNQSVADEDLVGAYGVLVLGVNGEKMQIVQPISHQVIMGQIAQFFGVSLSNYD
jgi:hypothetical protein